MAALIDKVYGHASQKEQLLQHARHGDMATAYIFCGTEGVGKKTLVRGLLQVLVCQRDVQACGVCNHCLRALEDKNEMVFQLTLEKKKTITVEQVRELHKFLSLKTMTAARFVIIDPADKMTTASSNALLKVLEEPPENTYFFLITSKLSSLLPTIRSRSQILRFQKLGSNELSHINELTQLSVDWCGGRYDYALKLLEEEAINYLNDSIQLFYSLLSEAPQDWKKKAPWFFNDDYWQDFCFHIWLQAIDRRLHGHSENLDWLPEEPAQLARLFDGIEDFRSDLLRHVDKWLAMENFYYKMREKPEDRQSAISQRV